MLNQIHNTDCLSGLAALPESCASLVIVDPPYFEIKGDFDFAWESFEAYLEDVQKWAIAIERVIAPNGTLFW